MKTLKKVVTIFVFMLSALTINAQVFQEWVRKYTNADSLASTAIAIDIHGCIYVTGNVSTFSAAGQQIATLRYSPDGTQQWAATFNNNGLPSNTLATGMAVDAFCNVYVTGFILSGFSCDIVTIKYDSTGAEQWVMKYNSPANKCDLSSGIKVDGAGNVYVSGSSQNNTFNFDFTVLKYNTNGTLLWDRQQDIAGDDRSSAIALDQNGNVYVTGQALNVSNFNGATVKYNSAGVLQWVVQFDGVAHSFDDAKAIAVDAQGNVHITGTSANTAGNTDFLTVKYNTSGRQLWAATFNGSGNGSDVAKSVVVDTKGNVIVTGSSVGIGTQEDFATVQYDKNGKLNWAQTFDGPAHQQDIANAMAVDAQDNIYITGQSQAPGIFNLDYATIKYNTKGELQWVQRFDGAANADDQPLSIALDANNNVYVTGGSRTETGPGGLFEFATVKYGQRSGHDLGFVPEGSQTIVNPDNSITIIPPTGYIYVGFTVNGNFLRTTATTISCTCNKTGTCLPFTASGPLGSTSGCTGTCTDCTMKQSTTSNGVLRSGGYLNLTQPISFVKNDEVLPAAFEAMFDLAEVRDSIAAFLNRINSSVPVTKLIKKDNIVIAPSGFVLAVINVFGRAVIVPVPSSSLPTGRASGSASTCECTQGSCVLKTKTVPLIGTASWCAGKCTGTCSLTTGSAARKKNFVITYKATSYDF